MSSVSVLKAGPERIDELEPLYGALHNHHTDLAPQLAGMEAREEAESWERRRPRYESWLGQPGAFVLIAEDASGPVGFALVTIEDGYDSWHSGPRIGEVHDIAVLPAARGAGVGTLLLDRVAEELRAADIDHYRLTVLGNNDEAIRFYERSGLTTITVQMLGPTS